MAITGIFVGHRIEHPHKLLSRCLQRTSAAKGLDNGLARQCHLAIARGTDLSKECRQVSSGSYPSLVIRTMNAELWKYGKDNAA